MKKLLGIVVLGLLLSSNVALSKDLTGLKLYCEQWGGFFERKSFIALDFINETEVIEYEIKDYKLEVDNNKYVVFEDKVEIKKKVGTFTSHIRDLDRSNLSYGHDGQACEKFKKLKANEDIKAKMKILLKKVIKKQKKDNKI